MKTYVSLIFLAIIAFLTSARADDDWKTIRLFEEVSTFDLKVLKYKQPLVFEWDIPIDVSGNNGVLPVWHGLLKTAAADLSNMSLKDLSLLYTSNFWSAISLDEAKFEAIKKEKAKLPESYPNMRYTLIYAEVHLRVGGQDFMYLLKVRGGNIQETKKIVQERLAQGCKSHTAYLFKKVDDVWKHHSIELDPDLLPILKKIPLSLGRLNKITKSGRAYFDVKVDPINMMPLEEEHCCPK